MRKLRHWCASAARGAAAVEFAITLPILLFFLGAVTDFGIVYYREACINSAVAAAAEYALLTDQRAQGTPAGPALTAANVQTVLSNAAAQAMPGISVTATASTPGTCYCITGSSPSSTMTQTACGATCASGGTATKYIQLTLSHSYSPILPVYSRIIGSTTISDTGWVPLQ